MRKMFKKIHYIFSYIITFLLLNSLLLNVNKFIFDLGKITVGTATEAIEVVIVLLFSFLIIKKYYKPLEWR